MCIKVVNWCFGSTVLTLARFFLLPLWQLLLVFAGFCLLLLASACSCCSPGLWWTQFHAEKEMGAKLVGLPGSAVATMLVKDARSVIPSNKICVRRRSMVKYLINLHLK